jgi:type I restriction enzyme M protein
VELTEAALRRFRKACIEASEEPLVAVVEDIAVKIGAGPHTDFNRLVESLEAAAEKRGVRVTAKRQKLLMTALGSKDQNAAPVIKKMGKPKAGADAERDTLYGAYHQMLGGKTIVIEYEPDSDLRDTEQVPFLEDGGIEAFFRREVLPHTPDAWIDEPKTIVGYEISFTRHFYKPLPLRTLEEIKADIRALEEETEGLLEDVLSGAH